MAAFRLHCSSSSLYFLSWQYIPYIHIPTILTFVPHSPQSPHPPIHKAAVTKSAYFTHSVYVPCAFWPKQLVAPSGQEPPLIPCFAKHSGTGGIGVEEAGPHHSFCFLKEDVVYIFVSCSGNTAAAVLPFILEVYLTWMTDSGQLHHWLSLKHSAKKHSYESILNDTSTLCHQITAQVKERKITEARLENVSFPKATINTDLTQVRVKYWLL